RGGRPAAPPGWVIRWRRIPRVALCRCAAALHPWRDSGAPSGRGSGVLWPTVGASGAATAGWWGAVESGGVEEEGSEGGVSEGRLSEGRGGWGSRLVEFSAAATSVASRDTPLLRGSPHPLRLPRAVALGRRARRRAVAARCWSWA